MTQKQTVNVVVDSREEIQDRVPHLVEHDEVNEFTIEELPTGDLVIEGVVFENKKPSDYASSITDEDDRLKDQVERMAEAYDHAYVLLEGDMSDLEELSHTQMKPQSLRGFAASLSARNGVPVIPCSNSKTLVDMAIRLARKHIEDPTDSGLRVKSSAANDAPLVERMYGCISGVGADTANSLHLQYPSLQDALDATVDDFTVINGVGVKTAETIHDSLHDTEISVTEERI